MRRKINRQTTTMPRKKTGMKPIKTLIILVYLWVLLLFEVFFLLSAYLYFSKYPATHGERKANI